MQSGRTAFVATTLALTLSLVGCGGSDPGGDTSPSTAPDGTSATSSASPEASGSTAAKTGTGDLADPQTGWEGTAESGECNWLTTDQIREILGDIAAEVQPGNYRTITQDAPLTGATSHACVWAFSGDGVYGPRLAISHTDFPDEEMVREWRNENAQGGTEAPGLPGSTVAFIPSGIDGLAQILETSDGTNGVHINLRVEQGPGVDRSTVPDRTDMLVKIRALLPAD